MNSQPTPINERLGQAPEASTEHATQRLHVTASGTEAQPAPNFDSAAGFIEALTGSPGTPLRFRTFGDATKDPSLTCVLSGTLAALWPELCRLNDAGAGVFFVVNIGGDTDADITALRALHTDHDGSRFNDAAVPKEMAFPDIIVESSPGNEHTYWRLRPGEPVDRFRDAQRQLIAHFGSDPKVKNLSRVLRLPGSVHRKGKPWLVKWDVTGAHGWHTIDDVVGCLPPAPPEATGLASVADMPDEAALAVMGFPDLAGRKAQAILHVQKIRDSQRSIQGESGSTPFLMVARDVVRGYVLPPDAARDVLDTNYNLDPWCVPPWVGREYDHKIDEAARFGEKPWGYCLIADVASAQLQIAVRDAVERASNGNAGAPLPARYGLHLERGDHAELADELLHAIGGKELAVFDEGEIWTYDAARGIYVQRLRDELTRIVKAFAGAEIRGRHTGLSVSDSVVNGTIKLASAEVARAGFFGGAPKGIAFADAFVTVQNGVIATALHSKEHRARHSFSFPYQLGLPHPKLDQFFADLFAGAPDGVERIALLQEFAGTCLIGEATKHQRCLVLYGSGGNGKSEVLELLRALFPPGAVSAIAPQKFAKTFTLSGLMGKLANFVSEMPNVDLEETEEFKSVIDGGVVRAERKYCDEFDMRPIAGHIYAGNNLPGTTDQSHGYWRRYMICLFDRNLEEASCFREHAHRDVIDHELGAVVAWALEGVARLQGRNGRYSAPATSVAALAEWRKNSDSVACFIQDETIPCEPSAPPESGTQASNLYQRYQCHARMNGSHPVASNKFAPRMTNLGKGPRKGKKANFYPVRLITGGGV